MGNHLSSESRIRISIRFEGFADSESWPLNWIPQLGALVPFLFLGECAPTKIDDRRKGILILTSLLEDLVKQFSQKWFIFPQNGGAKSFF